MKIKLLEVGDGFYNHGAYAVLPVSKRIMDILGWSLDDNIQVEFPVTGGLLLLKQETTPKQVVYTGVTDKSREVV